MTKFKIRQLKERLLKTKLKEYELEIAEKITHAWCTLIIASGAIIIVILLISKINT